MPKYLRANLKARERPIQGWKILREELNNYSSYFS
jgi:hypothetical protein